jgi:hypothetical protein
MVFQEAEVTTHVWEKINKNDLLIVQAYVGDIIFGTTNEKYVWGIFKPHPKWSQIYDNSHAFII